MDRSASRTSRPLGWHRVLAWCGLMLTLGNLCGSVQAFVVSTTTENISAPDDDPGWANIGILRGSTAVYLGDGWMLSASHVGVGTVNFPELGQFTADTESVIQLANPAEFGLNHPSDLIIFRLNEIPNLPAVPIGETPDAGDAVVVIGHGRARLADPTYWDVSASGRNWIWTETDPPGEYSGYGTATNRLLTWGTNLIEDDEAFENDFDEDIFSILKQSTTDTVTIITEFDMDDGQSDDSIVGTDGSSATPFESQAVLNDSGGAMFIKRAGAWQLIGTALAVEGHKDQPDPTRNAVFGNLTYYADLATYRDQIESHVVYGDFNQDLDLTAADLDELAIAMNEEAPSLRFDLSRDGIVDLADRKIWVDQIKGTYFGDANLDGEFGSSDLVYVWIGGLYEDDIANNATWATGDWDGDLDFTTSDLILALQTGAYEIGPRIPAEEKSVAVVPEPIYGPRFVLAIMAIIASVGRCRPNGRNG